MRQRGQGWFFLRALLMSLALLSVTQSVRADMSMTEANKVYSVRFRDWVYVYINMEFLQAAPAALDLSLIHI